MTTDETTPTPDPTPGSRAGLPTRLTARSPDDLVAFAPIALGFAPEESAVMLTFNGPRPFHARVDLPRHVEDCDEVVRTLLRPALRHDVARAAFLLYDDDTDVVDALAWELRDAFVAAGVEVIDVLRVHDGHWFAILPGHHPAHYDGVRCASGAHPFAAQAVADGHVTLGSREEVRRSVAADPAAVAAVERVLAGQGEAPLTVVEVDRLVARGVGSCGVCSAEEAVRLARAIDVGAVRDRVWCSLRRDEASSHVDFWRSVVRQLPDPLAASPAAVLAMAAWLAGDGALAWCAVDRCLAACPGHSLGRLVAQLLESAAPPALWEAIRPKLDPPLGGVA